jgi:hypothetical protein
MEDQPASEKPYPLSTSKLSKTPSWIMLGFLLGAAFVAALPPLGRRTADRSRPAPPAVEPPTLRAGSNPPAEPPRISTIEAVFASWGRYAVWADDDTTQVALWNTAEGAFNEFFEVRRFGGEFYFRTLPNLTRRVIQHGKPPEACPLEFTETEEQYREWLERNGGSSPMTPAKPRLPPPSTVPGDALKIAPGSTSTELPKFQPALPPNAAPSGGGQ